MSPYCILNWFDEHEAENCSLTRAQESNSEEPLGILGEKSTRAPKADSLVGDVKSTGRKRAVLVKPIVKGETICEWSGLKLAGSGVFPIVGCLDNYATDIHHGPDKNTLNNVSSNLHAICSICHNRWHTLNDPTYPPENIGYEWLPIGDIKPHDPETKFTPEEYLKAEIYWKTPVAERK